MHPFKPKRHGSAGPEAIIQEAIITRLKRNDWYVKVMVGNMFQHGVPDLYVAHRQYGQKWIEVKNPLSFSFTDRQQQNFPLMDAAGVGIWVLFSDSDSELEKLLKPANWLEVYLKWVNNVNSGKKT